VASLPFQVDRKSVALVPAPGTGAFFRKILLQVFPPHHLVPRRYSRLPTGSFPRTRESLFDRRKGNGDSRVRGNDTVSGKDILENRELVTGFKNYRRRRPVWGRAGRCAPAARERRSRHGRPGPAR